MPWVITTPPRYVDPDPYYTHILNVGPLPTYYWALREESGTLAKEEIVGGSPVTDPTSMTGAYFQVNFGQNSLNSATTKAVDFDPTNTSNVNSMGGAVPINEFNFIHQTGIFTMSCWIRVDTLTGERVLMGNESGTNGHGFIWEYISGLAGRTNALRFVTYKGTVGVPGITAFQDSAITASTPHHVAVKGDGTNVWFYVDGSEFMAVNTFVGFSGTSPAQNPNIGRWNDTVPGGYFDGVIEDFAVWNSTLSAGQIQAQYASGL